MAVKAEEKVEVARMDHMMTYDDRGYYDDYSYRDCRGSDWSHCDYWDGSRSWDYVERGK